MFCAPAPMYLNHMKKTLFKQILFIDLAKQATRHRNSVRSAVYNIGEARIRFYEEISLPHRY